LKASFYFKKNKIENTDFSPDGKHPFPSLKGKDIANSRKLSEKA
jgi:hypothetical protein